MINQLTPARFVGWLSLAVIGVLSQSHPAIAQLIAPELIVDGPKGYEFVVAVRSYSNGMPTSTVISRGQIPFTGNSQFRLALDSGVDGIQAAVAVAGHMDWNVTLADGSDMLASKATDSPGLLSIEVGEVAANDPLPDLAAFPDTNGKAMIAEFLSSIENADSKLLVSELPLANVDWPILNAYFEELHQRLGAIQYPAVDRAFSDWLTWEGSLGAIVYSGMVHFERGDCHFRFMTIDGKLVDVEPTAPKMPSNWLNAPPDCDVYTAQSQALMRALFAGEATAAQHQFSPRYQDDTSVDQVAKLSNQLRERFGNAVVRTGLVVIDLADAAGTDKQLNVTTHLFLDSGKECLGTVNFTIESGKDLVARAHLKSFYVSETLPSAHPNKTRVLTELLSVLESASVEEIADRWYEHFAVEVKDFKSLEDTQAFVRRIVDRNVRPINAGLNFDLWSYTDGNVSSSSGTVMCNTGQDVKLTVHWVGDSVYGVSVRSQWLADSTLGLSESTSAEQQSLVEEAAQRADTFWRSLLSGNAPEAHGQLSDAFAEKISVDQLREFAANGADPNAQVIALTDVTLDTVRMSEADDRSADVALAVHQLATFSDGSYLPLFAEFAVVRPQAEDSTLYLELRKFSSDVETTYPVTDRSLAERFAEPFIQQRPDLIVAMIKAPAAKRLDPRFLAAFTQVLSETSGMPITLSDRCANLRQASRGQQLNIIESLLTGPRGEVPFRAVFEFDELVSFQFDHPALNTYAHSLKDDKWVQDRVVEFIQAWNDPAELASDGEMLAPLLDENLRSPAAFQELGKLQREFQLDSGRLLDVRMLESQAIAGGNDLQFLVAMVFERGERRLRLTLTADALDAKVSSIETLEATAVLE